jgi:mannitol/fructose-specific phosphotransferase system IIA component (Ntr-type)
MRIFSQLSRLVMRGAFRQRLREERDPDQLLAFLNESFDLHTAVA